MRKILLAVALAGGASTASSAAAAEPTTWQYVYTGFLVTTHRVYEWEGIDETTVAFEPDATESGSFTGADDNGNGVIELSELTAFSTSDRDYLGCMASPSPYGRCHVSKFAYDLSGQLEIAAGWYGYDEAYSSWSGSIETGLESTYSSYGYRSEYSTVRAWTDQTRFAIIPAPVPEPASGLMAAAGVLLLGLRLISRRPVSRSS